MQAVAVAVKVLFKQRRRAKAFDERVSEHGISSYQLLATCRCNNVAVRTFNSGSQKFSVAS